jgi:hypothetical protein
MHRALLRHIKWMGFLLIVLILSACGRSDRHAGGVGGETTDDLSIQISRADGTPTQARLAVYRSNYLRGDSNQCGNIMNICNWSTNANGSIDIEVDATGKYSVWIEAGDELWHGELSREAIRTGLLKIQLATKVSLKGKAMANARIMIMGSDRVIVADSSGNFEDDSSPAQMLSLVAFAPEDSGRVQVSDAIASLMVDPMSETPAHMVGHRTLVDDFEIPGDRNRLGYVRYLGRDSAIQFQDTGWDKLTLFDTARQSHVFEAHWDGFGWAVAGSLLSTSPVALNDLDTIGFWIRGSGLIRLALEDNSENPPATVWTSIPITNEWTYHRIPVSQLDSTYTGDNLTWQQLGTHVNSITWIAEGTGFVALDQIEFIGVGAYLFK